MRVSIPLKEELGHVTLTLSVSLVFTGIASGTLAELIVNPGVAELTVEIWQAAEPPPDVAFPPTGKASQAT
ncbi:MAG: hypothetical protein WA688_04560 [Thermoplasmata archaeon]